MIGGACRLKKSTHAANIIIKREIKMQENSISTPSNANIIDQAQFEADKRAVYK